MLISPVSRCNPSYKKTTAYFYLKPRKNLLKCTITLPFIHMWGKAHTPVIDKKPLKH